MERKELDRILDRMEWVIGIHLDIAEQPVAHGFLVRYIKSDKFLTDILPYNPATVPNDKLDIVFLENLKRIARI